MQLVNRFRFSATLFLVFAMLFGITSVGFAQSKPQRPDTSPKGSDKKNERPVPKTEEELKKEADLKKQQEEEKNATVETEVLKLETNVVNVDTVVYNKKTGQIITGLKKSRAAQRSSSRCWSTIRSPTAMPRFSCVKTGTSRRAWPTPSRVCSRRSVRTSRELTTSATRWRSTSIGTV